jgi:hypothetical protein
MKKQITLLLLLFCVNVHAQSDTLQSSDGYVTPVFEVGCSSCYHPINLENYCHQIKKRSIKLYDLRGREFNTEQNIPIGSLYIKTGIMMDVNRKEYPFILKVIKL